MLLSIFEVFSESFQQYKEYFRYMLVNPSLTNPLYIVLIVCLLTFAMELVLPRKMNYDPIKRKGFKQDIFYVIFIDYLLLLFGFYAITAVVEYLFRGALGLFGIENLIIFDINQFSGIIQFLIIFISLDFMQWLGHFLLHRSDFLWKFHKIHHAQEELGFASTRHFHWMEYIVFKPLLFIPFSLMNLTSTEFVTYYLWVGLTFTFFSHTNVKVKFKPFNYIFISPETHYWHHAKNIPGRFGVNFASTLTLWDHIFGFFYYPKDETLIPELGVDDQKKIPTTFMGQMIYPFQEAFGKKKKSNPKKNKKAKA